MKEYLLIATHIRPESVADDKDTLTHLMNVQAERGYRMVALTTLYGYEVVVVMEREKEERAGNG